MYQIQENPGRKQQASTMKRTLNAPTNVYFSKFMKPFFYLDKESCTEIFLKDTEDRLKRTCTSASFPTQNWATSTISQLLC